MKQSFLSSPAVLVGTTVLAMFSLMYVIAFTVIGLPPSSTQLAQVVSSIPTSGQAAYWTLDDLSGADASGNGKTASISGGSVTSGKIAGAVSFSGSGSSISTPAVSLGGQAVTVSFWLNESSYTTGGTILESSYNYNNVSDGFGLFQSDTSTCPSNSFEAAVHGNSGYNVKCYSAPSAGWHHYALVLDNTQSAGNEVSLYIDGSVPPQISTVTQGLSQQWYAQPNTNTFGSNNLYFMSRDGAGGFIPGTLDDIRVYNRALSSGEVGQLVAYTGIAPSNPTQPSTPSTPADTTPPVISSVATNSVTTSGATISWTTNENSDSQVEYGTTLGYGSQTTLNSSLSTSHSATIAGLSAATAYHYRVHSKDAAGNQTVSSDSSFTTQVSGSPIPVPTTDTQAPTAPSGLVATAVSSSQINLSWNASTDNVAVVGYKIYRNGSMQTNVTGSLNFQNTSGLTAGTSYTYYVTAYDQAGNVSGQSNTVSVSTSPAMQQSQAVSATLSAALRSNVSAMSQTQSTTYNIPSNFVQVTPPGGVCGPDYSCLTYNGLKVVFRGENFNNGPGSAPGLSMSKINSTSTDYAKVRDPINGLGENQVRFGLTLWNWWDDKTPDHSAFYGMMRQQVQWAKANNIWLIPVLFIAPGATAGGYCCSDGDQYSYWNGTKTFDGDTEPAKQRATEFWADFAAHFKDEPTIAGYDIFNEPSPGTAEEYQTWVQATYSAIRAADPNHFVAVESEQADGMAFPTIYESGTTAAAHILWSAHCYYTCNPNPNSTGSASVSNWPLWIGEVGSILRSSNDMATVLKYYNDNGISWSHFVLHSWYKHGTWGLYQCDTRASGFCAYDMTSTSPPGYDEAGGYFQNPWTSEINKVRGAANPTNDPYADPTVYPDLGPIVSITSPSAGDVQGTVNITATASGPNPVTSVQFQVDGVNVGSPDTSSPYTYSWNSTGVTDGSHNISAVATDNQSLQGSASISVNVTNPSAPTITTQPQNTTGYVGSTASFSVNASGYPTNFTYQWQKSVNDGVTWTNVGGSTQTYTTTPAFVSGDVGLTYKYRVTVSNTINGTVHSATSDSASVTISTCDNTTAGKWEMDEGSGTTVGDSSCQKNDGTFAGTSAPAWVAGESGYALSFNGSNYVSLSNNAGSLNVANGGSISVTGWVKTSDMNGCIVSLRNNNNGNSVFDLCVGNDGNSSAPGHAEALVWYDSGSGKADVTSTQLVNDNTWHFVAAVLNQTDDTLKMYVDGVQSASTPVSNGAMSFTGSTQLAIGAEKNWIDTGFGTSDTQYLNGSIDDVRVYKKALNASEVADIYGGVTPPPQTYYSVNTSVTGNGSVSCSGTGVTDCSSILPGSTVTITETPAQGSTFSGWGGDCSGSGATCTIYSIGSDKSVTATFTGTVVSGNTYYIDYNNGNDNYTGTSETVSGSSGPWKHAPGMNGCSGNCAVLAATPPASQGGPAIMAGYSFILKGGVTWPNESLTWNWLWSGTAASPIYLGVDKTWFDATVCNGAFCRPKLDGQRQFLNGGAPIWNQGEHRLSVPNVFIGISARYLTIDNIEFTGLLIGPGVDQVPSAYIGMSQQMNIDIKNNYFHGWSDYMSPSDPNNDASGYAILDWYPQNLTSLSDAGEIEYNIFDGWDTPPVQADPYCTSSCLTNLNAIYGGINIHHNIFRYLTDAVLSYAALFHDNLIEHVRLRTRPGGHENSFELIGQWGAGGMIYNNVIRDSELQPSAGPQNGDFVTFNIMVSPGSTDYVFNNLIYNVTPGNEFGLSWVNGGNEHPVLDAGNVMVFNNTIEASSASQIISCPYNAPSNGYTYSYYSCTFKNNHIISTVREGVGATPNLTQDHNLLQTVAEASAQGYTVENGFAPTPGSGARETVGTGANLSTIASAMMSNLTDIARLPNAASLIDTALYSTTFACSYDQSNPHYPKPNCPTPVSRPSSGNGNWDIGAYQYNGGVPNPTPTASLSANPTSINSGQSSTLTWSSTDATSCTGTGGSFAGTKSTSGSQSVSPTVTTQYGISCTGTGGTSPVSNATVTVTSGTNPPSAPTNLTALANSTSEIDLSWTASTAGTNPVSGYNIYRDGSAAKLVTVAGTSYSNTGLGTAASHTYSVKAYDSQNNESGASMITASTWPAMTTTDYSIGQQVVTLSEANVRPAPTNGLIGQTPYGIQPGGTVATVTGRPVYASLGNGTSYYWWPLSFASTPTAGYVAEDNLQAYGTPPVDSDSDGVPDSSDLCPNTPAGSTLSNGKVNTSGCPVPLASNFTITPDLNTLGDLTSVKNTDITIGNSYGSITYPASVAGYDLMNGNGPLDINSNLTISRGNVSLLSANVPELNHVALITINITLTPAQIAKYNAGTLIRKDGNVFTCGMCAAPNYDAVNHILTFGVSGFSTYSIDDSVTPVVPPSAPSGLTATAVSTSEIDLGWTAATAGDNAISGYNIYIDGSQTPSDSSIGASYRSTGLSTGSTHSYTVTAFDNASPYNESALSNIVSATTQSGGGGGGGGGGGTSYFVLTVAKQGNGLGTIASLPSGISCTPASTYGCSSSFVAYSNVVLTATPQTGSHLVSWTGCSSIATSSCTVNMQTTKNITANFAIGAATTTPVNIPVLTNVTPIGGACTVAYPTITANLAEGSTGNDVTLLKKILVIEKFLNAGPIVATYDYNTTAAVSSFQKKHGIITSGTPATTGFGSVGTKTRTYINQLIAQGKYPTLSICSTGVSVTTTPVAPIIPTSQYAFTRNLTIGSTGADVKALQVFLNAHGFTVAVKGTGSVGHETTYYGPATASAVARFQQAYASTVLAPSGLTKGTGYFGAATKAKVNAIQSAGM